jgi:hypothetical protein
MTDPIKGFGLISDYAKKQVSYKTGIGRAMLTNVHPSLKDYAGVFSECTKNLANGTDRILRKHGKNIINKQFATRRLADIMIDLYVLGCVISRVSSSIATHGEAAAQKEVAILHSFSHQAERRIKANFAAIDDNDDETIKELSDYAVEKEGYVWDNL